ncbi:Outer membrane lipoprotein slyB precursor [Leclercia adecarboxylata]|uniref:Outer membrane lipoprotein slyB n=1 Tax=Leclercia adecarboxylata TaxID=83655 RepID=A0A4U9HSS1_9ENTR|nr:Outer membrane lipoprotein slyB precursor [Leclercia adecarboxylata]
MILRVLAVSLVGFTLAGCVNNDSLSGMFTVRLRRSRYKTSPTAPL